MDVRMPAFEPTLSVHRTKLRAGLRFRHWIVARQCWGIRCVTMNWKLLCKSPLLVPLTTEGSPQLHKDTTATSWRYSQNNTGTHIMLLNTLNRRETNKTDTNYKKTKTKQWKNSFLWTGPACAFDSTCSSKPHITSFFPRTSPFYKMIVRLWRFQSRFPILKASAALSSYWSNLLEFYYLLTLYYDYVKLTSIFSSRYLFPLIHIPWSIS